MLYFKSLYRLFSVPSEINSYPIASKNSISENRGMKTRTSGAPLLLNPFCLLDAVQNSVRSFFVRLKFVFLIIHGLHLKDKKG